MGLEGAAFGLFPIMWIVFNAVWIYNMTVETGHFAVLRRSFARISDDQRIQAVIIAFSFGALIEGLAGFGTPVAITAVMLIAVGFSPIKAAALSLIGNTAPVAFGSIAIPIVTLAAQTELPQEDLGAMVGRQTPFLALIVPLILVGVVDGARGVRQTWPAAMVGRHHLRDRPVRVLELHLGRADRPRRLAASRPSPSSRFLRVWSPSEPLLGEDQRRRRAARDRRRGGRRRRARAQRAPARPEGHGHARARSSRPSRRTSSSSSSSRSPSSWTRSSSSCSRSPAAPASAPTRRRQRLRLAGPRRRRPPRASRRRPRRSSSLLGHAGHGRAGLRAC